jgi:hypothetical protein
MAFVTPVIGTQTGLHNSYNIDFTVGAGKTNLLADVQLVQVLFRLVHFELKKPVAPPPGDKSIGVDGKVGPTTLRFIAHWQRKAKSDGIKVLLDGVFDPYRKQGELSHIAHVSYTFELLNIICNNECVLQSMNNYSNLPKRTDIPTELRGELGLPSRLVARQYASEQG